MESHHDGHNVMIMQTEYEHELEIMFTDVTALELIGHEVYDLHPVSLLAIDDLPF